MKRLIVILLSILPFFVFSQGEVKNKIDWVSLEKAKEYAKKYNKNILVYFHKKNCPYCEEMRIETFSNQLVIDIINNNFFPVKIDSRTKDTILYNGIKYSNQQPIADGSTWRHDFYAEVAKFTQKGEEKITTPTVALFNSKFEKITIFPGKQPKELLLRRIKTYIK